MSKTRRANVSLRPSELVIAAIHNMEERKGSTPEDIVDFISNKYSLNANYLRGHVEKALKRGVYFGVLKENEGLYQLQEMGVRTANKKPVQRKKRVTIKLPAGKNKRGTMTKKKAYASAARKKRTKSKNDLSKRCCLLKMARRKKQKATRALQVRKAQMKRRKARP
ncbi:hypothetical protein RUM43_006159 [Polyplax serrata]|uniref:H15 domain-containing protein n=1 Tax=Polyplax serrata TaxID=468196 RepID=A0AAN8PKR4_POLSC